jgi:hypothetical protein
MSRAWWGTVGVVVAHPRVQLGLGLLQAGEGPVGQELLSQALVEPLDLAGGGGRSDSGVAVGDPVLPADPIERDLGGVGTEPGSEHLAVIGHDLIGDPVAAKRGGEDLAHGLGGGPRDQAGGHAEPAVVVDSGEDLQLRAVIEEDASHHVHLPQLHGAVPFPSAELLPATASPPELDQAVPFQASIDGGPGWHGVHPGLRQLVLDAAGAPSRVVAAELKTRASSSGGIWWGQNWGRWDLSAREARPPFS